MLYGGPHLRSWAGKLGLARKRTFIHLGWSWSRCERNVILVKNVAHRSKVFSGEPPFPGCTPTSVVVKILLGERPGRPNHPTLTDELWVLTRQCLQENPRYRPKIMDVVCCLQRALVIRQNHPSASATNPRTQTVAKALRRAFGRIQRSPQPCELTPTEASGGVHSTSRVPRNWLQRARTWLLNLRSPLPYDSRGRRQSHHAGEHDPLLRAYTKVGVCVVSRGPGPNCCQ